jgi:hypothetical protein
MAWPSDVRKPFTSRIVICWVLFAFGAVAFPYGLWIFPSHNEGLLGMVGGGLIAAVLAYVLFALYRDRNKRMAGIQELVNHQQFLVHWTYTDKEWRRFIQIDWAARTRELRLVPVIGAIGGLLLGGLASAPIRKGGPPWHDEISLKALGVSVAAGFLGSVFIFIVLRLVAAWRRRKRMERVGEFYIGRHGIYERGAFEAYTDCSSPGVSVITMTETSGTPPILEFTIGRKDRSYSAVSLRVPIPAGQAGLAGRLRREFGLENDANA